MSNLLATMRVASSALDILQRGVTVAQNNVTNAATPGYVRQNLATAAKPFDPGRGDGGGVESVGLRSTRNPHAEAVVRNQVARLGRASELETSFAQVEQAFNLADSGGIAPSLDRLYGAFSQWSITPNRVGAKENVVSAATDVASSFQRAAATVEDAALRAGVRINDIVSEINVIAAHVRDFNESIRTGAQRDAGIDAQLHSDLERLAELVDHQPLWQEDGSVTVLLGGRSPLVIGTTAYTIKAELDDGPPNGNEGALPGIRIEDQHGENITGDIVSGRLAGLLTFRNETVPYYLGDSSNQGEMNRLAQAVADRVNEILASGYPPPSEVPPPYHLFVYGSSPISIAHTLKVNPSLAADLSALLASDASTDPPTVNGKALKLANLGTPTEPADMLNDISYVAFAGQLAAKSGRDLADASERVENGTYLAAQAKNMRAELSGISLDEEAVRLVEFQRAYQASARMIAVLDELTQVAVNIGRN